MRFKDNIWKVDLAEMGLLSSKNWNVKYLLCVIDIFIKYAWVKPLNNKKARTVHNSFIWIVNKSKHKPTKLWIDKGRGFYKACKNAKMIKDDHDIWMYSIELSHIALKFVVDDRVKIT